MKEHRQPPNQAAVLGLLGCTKPDSVSVIGQHSHDVERRLQNHVAVFSLDE
jgi:hypothetical protein